MVIIEYYPGQSSFTVCKEVNRGGDMKTITIPIDELDLILQRLQDIRYTVQSHSLAKARDDRLDKLT